MLKDPTESLVVSMDEQQLRDASDHQSVDESLVYEPVMKSAAQKDIRGWAVLPELHIKMNEFGLVKRGVAISTFAGS